MKKQNMRGEVVNFPTIYEPSELCVATEEEREENVGKRNRREEKKWWENQIAVAVISSVTTAAICFVGGRGMELIALPQQMQDMKVEMEELQTSISSNISELRDEMDQHSQFVQTQITNIYANMVSYLAPTKNMKSEISAGYNVIGGPEEQGTTLTAQTVVAYDRTTFRDYTVSDLAGQKVLLPYESNGQEVYFYGQFNDQGQWDGNCLINVYENDCLVLITDAVYEDGELLSYRQVFSYEMSGEMVWAYADRVKQEGSNPGETYLYKWTQDYEKTFTLENVVGRDIMGADGFRSLIDDTLCAYYNGAVSDNLFNDDSGNAFMVRYFDDGTVNFLYCGGFKDGKLHDKTGNAWYVIKDEDTDYMYVKGIFSNNKVVTTTEEGHPPLTKEEILGYIGERDYKVPLNWAGFGPSFTA